MRDEGRSIESGGKRRPSGVDCLLLQPGMRGEVSRLAREVRSGQTPRSFSTPGEKDPSRKANTPVRCIPRSGKWGPGSCPNCGMALEPREVTAEESYPELANMTRRLWISVALAASRGSVMDNADIEGRFSRMMVNLQSANRAAGRQTLTFR